MITIAPALPARPYSLHDCAVTAMEAQGDTLRLLFADGFYRLAPPQGSVAGLIELESVDWDFCCAYCFDPCGSAGRFSGEKRTLKDFAARLGGKRFEVVDEVYGYRQLKLAGTQFAGARMLECVLEIAYAGEMRYITEE